jgi:hypothetical protein
MIEYPPFSDSMLSRFAALSIRATEQEQTCGETAVRHSVKSAHDEFGTEERLKACVCPHSRRGRPCVKVKVGTAQYDSITIAATALGIEPNTVRNKIRSGHFQAVR